MAFTFDPAAGQYLDAAGHPVPASTIREVANSLTAATAERLAVIADQRASGTIDTLEWRTRMEAAIKQGNVAAAALGYGGTEQMGPKERGATGARVRAQNRYLQGFSLDIGSGKIDPESDAFRQRAVRYATSVGFTFEAVNREVRIGLGTEEERNVLGSGSGSCPECDELAGLDWQPAGSMPEIGERTCGPACNCSWEYRSTADVGEEAVA